MKLYQLINTVNDIFYSDSNSYKVIESKANELLSIIGANTDINNINDTVINKVFNTLKNKGNKPATINSKMVYLSKLLKYAYQTHKIKHKPYIPLCKINNKKDIFLS